MLLFSKNNASSIPTISNVPANPIAVSILILALRSCFADIYFKTQTPQKNREYLNIF